MIDADGYGSIQGKVLVKRRRMPDPNNVKELRNAADEYSVRGRQIEQTSITRFLNENDDRWDRHVETLVDDTYNALRAGKTRNGDVDTVLEELKAVR